MGEVQAVGLSVQPQRVGTQYLGGNLWLHPTSATVPSQNLSHNLEHNEHPSLERPPEAFG